MRRSCLGSRAHGAPGGGPALLGGADQEAINQSLAETPLGAGGPGPRACARNGVQCPARNGARARSSKARAVESAAGPRQPTLVASAAEAASSDDDGAGLDAMLTAIQAEAKEPLPGHGAKTP